MSLHDDIEAYAAYLNAHMAAPDDEEIYKDMLKAKAAMETSWLEAKPTHHDPIHRYQRPGKIKPSEGSEGLGGMNP